MDLIVEAAVVVGTVAAVVVAAGAVFVFAPNIKHAAAVAFDSCCEVIFGIAGAGRIVSGPARRRRPRGASPGVTTPPASTGATNAHNPKA